MDTPTLSLRPATPVDEPLFRRLHLDTMRPWVEATWGWDDADQLARFRAAFTPANRHVIRLDGVPIGGLQVDLAATPVRLLNLQILPAFQRRGHGAAVIGQLLAQAGGRPVWLQVLKVNPARRLYERLGFRVTGDTGTHWQMLHVRQPEAASAASQTGAH